MEGNHEPCEATNSTLDQLQERFRDFITALHEDVKRTAADPSISERLPMEVDLSGFRYILSRVPSSRTNSLNDLTSRELEISRLVAQSLSNKLIGKRLEISPATVAAHLRSAFKKAGVTSRGELTSLVMGHTRPAAEHYALEHNQLL